MKKSRKVERFVLVKYMTFDMVQGIYSWALLVKIEHIKMSLLHYGVDFLDLESTYQLYTKGYYVG